MHDLLAARETLAADGLGVRVVSLPDWNLFMAQPQGYRDEVLPPEVWRRVSLEAGATFGWSALVGERGTALGLDRYGASAPAADIARELGITPEAVVAAVRALALRPPRGTLGRSPTRPGGSAGSRRIHFRRPVRQLR